MSRISLEELENLLVYDPKTGLFTWIDDRNNHRFGKVAGWMNKESGYIKIEIQRKIYYAHVLVYFYMTGNWPNFEVDHINRIRHDNRWENLREAQPFENCQNKGKNRNNKSGYIGVDWHKATGKWRARVCYLGISYVAGYFNDPLEASIARQSLKEELHLFNPIVEE